MVDLTCSVFSMSNSIEKYFNFFLIFNDFDTEYLSSEIVLLNMPWHIKVIKRSIERKYVIDMFLVNTFDTIDTSMDWFCEAEMSVTLLQSNESDQLSLAKNLPKTEFTKQAVSCGLMAFIEWDNLKLYERQGKVWFGVHLSANPDRLLVQSDIAHSRIKYRFAVEDIGKFRNDCHDCYDQKNRRILGCFLIG